MRNLVTFIVRLWVDPQAEPPAWEGRIECVADGERAHVRGGEELLRFVEAHVVRPKIPLPEEMTEKEGGNR